MTRIKNYIWAGAIALTAASCNDFLTTNPYDALLPSLGWKTEDDAQKFAVSCYGGDSKYVPGWQEGSTLLYMDCMSDFAYSYFPWEEFTAYGNGSFSASDGKSFYDYSVIRRCNTFLGKVEGITFGDPAVKKDLIAQVRFLRAYQYFIMNWMYGGVPIISNYMTADEAKVPRDTEAKVRGFIEKELDECTADLKEKPSELGRVAKGAALALRMREALYYGDWATAKDRAEKIKALNQYSLENNYSNLFRISGKSSKEIILAVQYIPNTKTLTTIGRMYNNGDGGWSSIVPTQNLVDAYEMANGLTKDEAGSGYDPTHPYANRDPRMGMSIYYPGSEFTKDDGTVTIFNTLDKEIGGKINANYPLAQDNSSKTALTWAKYLDPITQYKSSGIWETEASPIVFRYAEVLLTYAEAENELSGPSSSVYDALDHVRARAGMPAVDRAKYATKDKLRELIHRERAVEFAGEGLRRADIVRWKTPDGKMVAEKVLNGALLRVVGTVSMDASVSPSMRAKINPGASKKERLIEERVFKTFQRYLPIPQSARDKNPQLSQNDGY